MADEETPDRALIAAAAAVRDKAYAPYSRFKVGAAIRAADGRIYLGANVENASYPAGLCAETAALAAMVAGGGGGVLALAVVAEGAEPIPPCGLCRQRLAELATPETPIHLGNTAGIWRTVRLGDLLPYAFSAHHLTS